MTYNLRIILTGLFVLALLSSGLGLLGAAGTKKLRVEYEKLVSVKEEEKVRVTTLTGDKDPVHIYHEDSLFTAKKVVMRSQDSVHEFTCTGSPVFTDPETRITSEKVVGYSTPRRAEFSGNVKMVATPKKKTEEKGDVRGKINEPTTITAQTMSYDYANKRGAARGDVVVLQKTRTIWADAGTYDQQKELVVLTGNVRLKNTGEDELKEMKDAESVTVSLENDWIEILAKPNGRVTMDLEVKDDEGEKKPANGK